MCRVRARVTCSRYVKLTMRHCRNEPRGVHDKSTLASLGKHHYSRACATDIVKTGQRLPISTQLRPSDACTDQLYPLARLSCRPPRSEAARTSQDSGTSPSCQPRYPLSVIRLRHEPFPPFWERRGDQLATTSRRPVILSIKAASTPLSQVSWRWKRR